MAQNSSRLQRLLTLLDTGSTQTTRVAAARQIGEIAKSHPQDLNPLLKKVSQYLRSKSWDTRVAAAQAIGAIAENVKHTTLKELLALVEAGAAKLGILDISKELGPAWCRFDPDIAVGLTFKSFQISKVLEFGSPLLASGGQEYDVANDNRSPAERLARQKQNLRRRLGLDVCEQFMDVSEVIRDEDLMVPQRGHGPHGGIVINGNNNGNSNWAHPIHAQPGRNIQQLVATMVPGSRSKRLSARELNLLKRKAKSSAKDHTKTPSEDEKSKHQAAAPSAPNELHSSAAATSKETPDTMAEEESAECEESGKWPFHNYVDQLIHDIFDPVWEVRHGAMMALREILTHQGSCARVYLPDLTLDNLSLPEFFDDKINPDAKRSREFDLNKQFGSLEENEPDQKRLRFSEEALVNGANALPEPLVVGVKIETDLGGRTDFKLPFSGVTGSVPVSDLVTNITENSKLMKLVKLYQYACLKNWEFLQDCAIRFICVLSLDRFGDYVSDQVVAPVRETCAQALGAVLKYMDPSLVNETLNVLLQMQCRQEWEIRHGSLLGIKYLIAVRKEMIQNLLMYVLPACKAGLEDPDDDVRAVAADALLPTAASLVALDDQILNPIVMLLWDILLDLDDLSPSTSSVMNLLAEIYSQPEMVPKMLDKLLSAEKHGLDINIFEMDDASGSSPYALATLVPRLWPFMRHTITSVRNSAICTFERLLEVNKGSSNGTGASKFWPSSILGDAMRIVFQNLLLEANDNILESSERVWRLLLQCPERELEVAAGIYFSSWVELATTPYGSALDSAKMFLPVALPRRSASRAAAKMRTAHSTSTSSVTILDFSKGQVQQPASASVEREVPVSAAKIVVGADSEKSVTHTRVLVSTALGVLASKLPPSSWQVVVSPLWRDLTALSGVQRQVASMILATWFKELRNSGPAISQALVVSLGQVKQWLLDLLSCTDPGFPTKDSPLPYTELSRTYAKMRHEANHFLHLVKSSGAIGDSTFSLNLNADNLTIDEAIEFATNLSVPPELQEVESAKQLLLATCGYLKCVQNNLHVAVSALVASAVVWTRELPSRLNPVILPLMAAIKREQEEILQQKAAEGLAELIFNCVARKPSPNDKLIKNICTLTCADPNETPQATLITSMEVIEEQNLLSFSRVFGSHSRSRHHATGGEERSKLEGFISRRGSEMALKHLCEKFGSALFEKLPKVWDCLTELLIPVISEDPCSKDDQLIVKLSSSCEDKDPQSLINNIQVVRSIASLVHELLRPQILSLLPCILGCVRHSHVAIRLAASRCVTSMAKSITASVMTAIIETVIPMLSDETSVNARQGAGILVSLLVQGLGVELVPYAPLLVVPLLRCMSDSDKAVRQSVTNSFAALVPLLPLAKGATLPDGLDKRLSSNAEDARFLEQLLDNSHIEDYKLSVDLKVGLRRYQQEGINWLAFLRRFKLHGILCDDMGLGKTLQASAIVATDIAERRANAKEENYSDPLSIIVCPTTLVAHWAYEIEKHIDTSVMSTIQYVGSAPERTSLQSQFDTCNVVITSYDIIRKDIDFLGKIVWNYCILDEGHIIKSSRSKITSAVKLLKSEHRLILSGTPIQNNVLELWSLFDFLMPGFLGTEKQFQSTYGKPLIAAKDPKCSAKDAEAGILAMEALHKQVMPFLLRRTKDEVLSDLPEKIIQDRYCDLSPLQLKLYEQFSTSNAKEEISTIVKSQETEDAVTSTAPKATTHVFQVLQYLLKLCSHPLLVVGNQPPQTMESIISEVVPGCRDMISELHELYHSPKLVALQEILEECGIGLDASTSPGGSHAGQHRVLIFAQHKAFLDIIERDLFQSHMRSVTYLRLDGTVQAEKRFEIVKAFNSDPTIDVLLLTTHVGGLGLNLTSADTLVFMEHDWNPMKDLQAMDRAHRLGQKKVVNVHRLIMRGTLEEKVMSLQRFKVSVANAVINAENASLKTMNTDQLLDLFASTPASRKGALLSRGSSGDPGNGSKPKGKGLKSILNGLEELWDQSQYTDEYDMTQFLAKLNG